MRSSSRVSSLAVVAFLAACGGDPAGKPVITGPADAPARLDRAVTVAAPIDLGEPSEGGPFAPDLSGVTRFIQSGLRAVAVNEQGQVAVRAYTRFPLSDPYTFESSSVPFLWKRGTFELVAVTGWRDAVVKDVTNHGVAVGHAKVEGTPRFLVNNITLYRAVVFGGGSPVVLPDGPVPAGFGPVMGSRASGINDAGDVVGARIFCVDISSEGRSSECRGSRPRATLWRRGSYDVVDLGALEGGRGSEAFAINNRGQAVGRSAKESYEAGGPQQATAYPVLFADGRVTELGGLPERPDCGGRAMAINERGEAAGGLCGRAVVWDQGRPVPLASVAGTVGGEALAINDVGDVVGSVSPTDARYGPYHAYQDYTLSSPSLPALWRDGALTLLPTLPSDLVRGGVAHDVNNRGQVVGMNVTHIGMRAVLWTVK